MATTAPDIDTIYQALSQGRGREFVDDHNVQPLIDKARAHGDAQLELLLREWRSPCGDDPEAPVLPPSLPPA